MVQRGVHHNCRVISPPPITHPLTMWHLKTIKIGDRKDISRATSLSTSIAYTIATAVYKVTILRKI